VIPISTYIPWEIHPGLIPGLVHPGLIPGLVHPGLIPGLVHPGFIPGLVHPGLMPGLVHPGLIPGLVHPGLIPSVGLSRYSTRVSSSRFSTQTNKKNKNSKKFRGFFKFNGLKFCWMLIFEILNIHKSSLGSCKPTKFLNQIGSAVLTCIRYQQTNTMADKQSIYV